MINLTIVEALEKLNNGEISSVELTKAYLDRIEQYGADLNCYITTTPERAMADAAASDARRASGDAMPLDGIPLAMKDLFATRGIRTTAASRMLENFVPEYESTVSQNLINAGTVLL
ncbi:MAG: Asp-tRNA(Asn)/Glu-tRNA(Gln) amidotransferase subunit GatA, partial [Alphaproteobacteria bacterium]|nr:Asp-tRNA(Asn)/Glu-tRNA(Gln) amidotransferase subunit GatA [Alphaproteobacteria bacterium]